MIIPVLLVSSTSNVFWRRFEGYLKQSWDAQVPAGRGGQRRGFRPLRDTWANTPTPKVVAGGS
jgi:hypothetical protein